ncbi:MAG: deoxyguanosinetriphosphate triphosphohydrolase [candidate division Zixibacteria bacterium 4484_95]|nr:MAG: deoxyguanosinetriphosphate triphosphohydrolase [candidate division Zixibacteria bacterium 4484_95]
MSIVEELEKREEESLAPYAMKSSMSRGRQYDEPKHPYRTEFQRDRERIIHSTSFRRLEYKTQVFVNHEGDHYRTRLTHTIEVSQIARCIARALRLNEDLTEGIALAHDLGHTPFGHSGELTLNKLMEEHGGFEHNRQGLRVVDYLEHRYPDFQGLNLTFELREGILKHETVYDNPSCPPEMFPLERPSLECQVINIADEIAYTCHDVDDGLSSGLISVEDLLKLELWKKVHDGLVKKYPAIRESPYYRYQMIKMLINEMVTDALKTSLEVLEKHAPKNPDDVRRQSHNLICRSQRMQELDAQIKQFLYENMYRHYRLVRMAEKAELIITTLFKAYTSNIDQLPPGFRKRIENEDANLVVADYIAGMTDRFAGQEYKKMIEPFEPV